MNTNQETSNQVTNSNSTAAAVDVVPVEPALTPEAVADVLRPTRARSGAGSRHAADSGTRHAGADSCDAEESATVSVMGGRETGRAQARPVVSFPFEEGATGGLPGD